MYLQAQKMIDSSIPNTTSVMKVFQVHIGEGAFVRGFIVETNSEINMASFLAMVLCASAFSIFRAAFGTTGSAMKRAASTIGRMKAYDSRADKGNEIANKECLHCQKV